MPQKLTSLSRKDALIVTDVQRDFLPGGSLAINRGDEVIEPLNRAIRIFESQRLPIFSTRDWHPPNHCSFHASGGPWPSHCVAGTYGAEFDPRLKLPRNIRIISKATQSDKEAYSTFQGTGLHKRLQANGISRVFIGGLATEYCILNSVKDAIRFGYQVFVLKDAVRGINIKPDDEEKALVEMERLGAILRKTTTLTGPDESRSRAA